MSALCAAPTVGLYSCSGQSLAMYAAVCEEATQIAVPEFNCDRGTEVPEHNLTGVWPEQYCDAPNVLLEQCDPGSRFQVVNQTADAIVVAHCRKQNQGVDSNGAGLYGDIAVIQYNKSNGATCFYQALAGTAGGPLPARVTAPTAGSGSDKFPWQDPSTTAGQKCVFCHDNGPFVRSPYLAQLRDAGQNPDTGSLDHLPGTGEDDAGFDKSGWNLFQPYAFAGADFEDWKAYQVSVGGGVTCTGCHRMGLGTIDGHYSLNHPGMDIPLELGSSLLFGPRATAPTQPHKNPHSATSPIWMKPDQIFFDASTELEAKAVHECALAIVDGGTLPSGCSATLFAEKFEQDNASAQAASASPTSAAHFVQPTKVTGEGSCMCSLCWNQAFCFDPARPEGARVYAPPCDQPEHEAVDAKRLVDATSAKAGGFYCWKPFPDAIMDATDKSCPSAEADRANVENFDPCIDAPLCARSVDECGLGAHACPEEPVTARPSACVEVPGYLGGITNITTDATHGATAVVDALATQCARFGDAPPSGPQPERYCYLSCVNAHDCELDTLSPSCVGCESKTTVQSVAGTFPVEMDPESTAATVFLKDLSGDFQEVGSMGVSGRLHFQVPAECQGSVSPSVSCAATMTRMALASVGTLTLGVLTLSNVRLVSDEPAANTFATAYTDGTFYIPSHTKYGLTGDVTGLEHRYVMLDPAIRIGTTWDWTTRLVSIDVTLLSKDGTLAVQLAGTGSFDSLPPTSVATASRTTVPCGQSTVLSAESSTDPDGSGDILSVTWTTDRKDLNDWQATGASVEVYPKIGTTRYYAKVVDSVGSTHTSYVDVTMTCDGCSGGTPDQFFTLGVMGCGGTETWDQRDTLCSTGFATCTAAEWNAHRRATLPTNDYWTDDNLQYSGTSSACEAVYSGGTSCGTNRPMRVCTPDGTDVYGNTCGWTGCGLNTTDDEYFGGCTSDTTAGSLCCAQPVCAGNVAPDDVFTPGLIGCGGAVTWDQRATLCGAGYAPCAAAQWKAYRGGAAPTKNYWTDDFLGRAGRGSGCAASFFGGSGLCGTSPMHVCTAGGTDSYGNSCTYTNCGLETAENEYFGGCGSSNPTAGTLCCAQ